MSVDEAVIERLAQAVHEQYLRERVRDGIPMGSTAAMTSWSGLDEDLQESNRDQARAIEAMLAQDGWQIAPATGAAGTGGPATGAPATGGPDSGGCAAWTDEDIERLAQQEHLRWARQRLGVGWTFGDVRDGVARRHPSLVDWAQLSESERDKDREAVRNIPRVLAAAGLRLTRGG